MILGVANSKVHEAHIFGDLMGCYGVNLLLPYFNILHGGMPRYTFFLRPKWPNTTVYRNIYQSTIVLIIYMNFSHF